MGSAALLLAASVALMGAESGRDLSQAASQKTGVVLSEWRLAAGQVAVVVPGEIPGPNLLLNSGFEDWELRTDTYPTQSGAVPPIGWSQQTDTVLMPRHWYAERVTSCCIWPELANAVSQGEPHSGTYGLRLGGDSGDPLQTGIHLAQDVPVIPGFPYLTGFWSKGYWFSGARRMRGTWLDAGGQPVGTAFFLPAPNDPSQYVLVQGTTTFAPCNAAAVRVQFDKADWGSVLFDDGYFGQNLGAPPDPCSPALDIKPGSFPNSINARSEGLIPVAILSTAAFSAPAQVDRASLTFGRTGDETSLEFCSAGGVDVDGNLLPDLVCHFSTQATGFQTGDTQGILKGRTLAGAGFILADSVRIVP